MLTKATFFAFFSLLLAFSFFLTPLYLKQTDLSLPSNLISKSPLIPYKPICQLSKEVTKDLWVTNEKERLHHRIKSDSSLLVFLEKTDSFTLIEEMNTIEGYLQEKVDDAPSQELRFISSDQGIYHYTDHTFSTDEARFALFRLHEKTLPSTLDPTKSYASGIAKDVTLSFTSQTPLLQAKTLQAKIEMPGKSSI